MGDLIPDTTVLTYLMYGTPDQRSMIETIFKKRQTIKINETIKSEVGRTIFNSYFLLKTDILELLDDIANGKLSFTDFFAKLHSRTQKRHKQRQLISRLQSIIAFLYDKLLAVVNFPNTQKSEMSAHFCHSIKVILYKIEMVLYEFQKRIFNFEYVENYECHQTNWHMEIIDQNEGYFFKQNSSCAKTMCPDRIEILKKIYSRDPELIEKLISGEIYSKLKLDKDNKLVSTLEDIKHLTINGAQRFIYQKKHCWNLADLLIGLCVDGDTSVFTANIKHFKPILELRGLSNQLIPFYPLT